jgi:hypothetical protein
VAANAAVAIPVASPDAETSIEREEESLGV